MFSYLFEPLNEPPLISSINSIYSVYCKYTVYTVYSIYCVYSINSEYTVYTVYSIYCVYSINSEYTVPHLHGEVGSSHGVNIVPQYRDILVSNRRVYHLGRLCICGVLC